MLPANDVRNVLPFLVIRLFKLNDNAVKKDMDVFFFFSLAAFFSARVAFLAAFSLASLSDFSSIVYGFESALSSPSSILIIRVEYCSASSGLCVTIMIRRSFAISLSNSIICTLVSESRAPVGSSASKISGLFTNALAIATLCI